MTAKDQGARVQPPILPTLDEWSGIEAMAQLCRQWEEALDALDAKAAELTQSNRTEELKAEAISLSRMMSAWMWGALLEEFDEKPINTSPVFRLVEDRGLRLLQRRDEYTRKYVVQSEGRQS